ncbi:flagellar hook assembly protein FlgD [Desnuesiella massiliensis]|uniref:flagellar hook assembly protein FlgD n=1 Tax=Desnuesiella massiliensis TaxID=1650662 RepID=UPI000938E376|nr:flagellar hook capping FlgD N-terminal domain-containing protein [Desnuesiella massiliensis]
MSDVNVKTNTKAPSDFQRPKTAIGNEEAGKTKRGTRIVKSNGAMDKNAFLKILSAELSNQDPMNSKDSTQFIAQMAQFASMEQMYNLNNTMSSYAANNLVGKGITLKLVDGAGKQVAGIVRTVTKIGDKFKIGVELNKDGKVDVYEFDSSEIDSVLDVPDYRLDFLNGNTSLLAGASMIGKKVEFNVKDSQGTGSEGGTSEGEKPEEKNIVGIVKGVVRENGIVKLKVQVEGKDEIKTIPLDNVIKVDVP